MIESYKTLLSQKLQATESRSLFTGTEVRDILLDLWLALDEATPDPLETAPDPLETAAVG